MRDSKLNSQTTSDDGPKLFRGYSAKQLEVQYDNRGAVPEYEEISSNWAQHSATIRQNSNCQLDLSYGSREREKIDFFECDRSRSPLLIFVHGGYWQRGEKSNFSFIAEKFLEQDVNVALVGYDLCPTVGVHQIVDQIRSACVWLWKNPLNLNFDRDRIFISGHSAGGHLSAMTLVTDWQKIDASLPPAMVQGGLPMSGIFELQPLLHTSINHALSLDSVSARDYSPVFLSPSPSARIFLGVGALESDELRCQTQTLAANWHDKVLEIEAMEVPGANHFTILDCFSDITHPLFQKSLSIING